MNTDQLAQARVSLDESCRQDAPEWASACAEQSKAAALIAIAEELRTLNATLHNATDLTGAVKTTMDQVQIDSITGPLNSVSDTLANAEGPDGAIKVYAHTFNGEQY